MSIEAIKACLADPKLKEKFLRNVVESMKKRKTVDVDKLTDWAARELGEEYRLPIRDLLINAMARTDMQTQVIQ